MRDSKHMQKVKMKLMMQSSVFISSVLFSLKMSWNNNIPTAGTDGKNLIINKEWFESLSTEEAMG